MKKIISLILAATLCLGCIFVMGSCKKEEDNLSAAYDKAIADIGYDASQYTETLTVAMSPDFAPMEFYDTAKNEIVGFDVILATYIAKELGMKVFLLDDCIINKSGEDISVYPHGSFDELIKYVGEMN